MWSQLSIDPSDESSCSSGRRRSPSRTLWHAVLFPGSEPVADPGFFREGGACQTGDAFHSTGAPKCQGGATFFEGARHILWIVRIWYCHWQGRRRVLKERHRDAIHYHLLLRRRFVWGAVAWVVGVGSAKARLIYSRRRAPDSCKGTTLPGGATAPATPWIRAWPELRLVGWGLSTAAPYLQWTLVLTATGTGTLALRSKRPGRAERQWHVQRPGIEPGWLNLLSRGKELTPRPEWSPGLS